ncbi:hypothetical protein J4447_03530 [Candidatus Pacearchaeota archaeon]|nr:hypothetical protein [Candidatus Pacearchaeota archaeon]
MVLKKLVDAFKEGMRSAEREIDFLRDLAGTPRSSYDINHQLEKIEGTRRLEPAHEPSGGIAYLMFFAGQLISYAGASL